MHIVRYDAERAGVKGPNESQMAAYFVGSMAEYIFLSGKIVYSSRVSEKETFNVEL